jgi:hypothetical protein
MRSDYWPAHAQMIALPLGEDFWSSAWQVIAQLHTQHSKLTVLAAAHWPLAEIARAACAASSAQGRATALPAMHALGDWLARRLAQAGQAPASALQRQLVVQEALQQLPAQGVGGLPEPAQRALMRQLLALLDGLDVAQFPYADAASTLRKQIAAEPFSSRELAIANAVANVLAGIDGPVQQQLALLRYMPPDALAQQQPLLLLALDPHGMAWAAVGIGARLGCSCT